MASATCGADMRFISSRRVCRWPSEGRLFLRASSRKEVHCWTRFVSMNTSTIWNTRYTTLVLLHTSWESPKRATWSKKSWWHIILHECLSQDHTDGLTQDCVNSSALALELLQSCTMPSTITRRNYSTNHPSLPPSCLTWLMSASGSSSCTNICANCSPCSGLIRIRLRSKKM